MAKAAQTATEVKTIAQLREELAEKRQALLELRRHLAAGELANPRVLPATRKDIARLETALQIAVVAEQKESK